MNKNIKIIDNLEVYCPGFVVYFKVFTEPLPAGTPKCDWGIRNINLLQTLGHTRP